MSADPDQEFLADGIAGDVIAALSGFRSPMVIAPNSTVASKGTTKDVRQIAKELGVLHVVRGSVRRAGNRIRMTAELIGAEADAQMRADRWDRDLDDIFTVQDEMTAAICPAAEPELGAHERKPARSRPPESLTAWESHHTALRHPASPRWFEKSPNDLEKLIALGLPHG